MSAKLLEALRRFPEYEAVKDWQWGAAYDLGRSEASSQASDYYAFLISSALNEQPSLLAYLPDWWEQHEPGIVLTLTQVQPFPGNLSNYILFLDGLGGAYFWLVESEAGFQVYPIFSLLHFYRPRLSNLQFGIADITGDGFPEAIVIARPLFEDGRGGSAELHAFDLTQQPPQPIHFIPPPPNEFITGWSPTENGNGLQIIKSVDAIDCPVYSIKTYRWNGHYQELESSTYPTETDLASAERPISMEGCIWYAEPDLLRSASWGDVGAMEWLDANLTGWPPSNAPIFSGDPYPADIQDQLRFRLGLYYAFAGRYDQARQHFATLIASPTLSTTQWIELSEQFLATYSSPNQLAEACRVTQACYPIIPLPRLITLIPPDTATPLDIMESWAIPIEAAGTLDFDQDQQTDQWFVTRSQDDTYYELWLLVQPMQAVRVGRFSNAQNATMMELPPVQGKATYKLVTADNELIFTVERDSAGQLITTEYSTYAYLAYQTALQAFILGQPAEQIRDTLLNYGETPYQDCNPNGYRNFCADLLYLQGLAYELSGDEANAIATYLQLWQDYPDHPYTLIIRAKLEPQ